MSAIAADALASGRIAAEALMVDTCRITAPGEGDPVRDEETGQYVDPARVTVYEGKCRLQARASAGTDSTDAERLALVQEVELQLPIDGTDDVRTEHVVEYLTATHDLALVGRFFRVAALHHKSHATSRRLRVDEITG